MRVLPAGGNGREEDRPEEDATPHPEQIISKLREAERMLAQGKEVPEVAKALEV